VIGFNVESGGANPAVVADLIEGRQGTDIWGFSEVQNAEWASLFEEASAEGESAEFRSILGSTGGADRLLIVYNADRLELVRNFELDEVNIGGHVRASLVAQFRVQTTGHEFLFMVNHLYRSREDRRHEQGRMLNEWARQEALPIVAVGDYNFDWEVEGGETDHDEGFDNLTANGVFTWVRPATLLKTQCSEQYNSVLDFVFVAGDAQRWERSSEILEAQPIYCPDDDTTSDHRPVLATFNLSPGGEPSLRDILLRRIRALEEELAALRALIEAMED
jgi:endonuclease/exonuclease/phosphatase family metal-dependent hydrolase